MFIQDEEARELILEIGRRMYAKNYVAANDGNISVRTGKDSVWVTPTGVSKGYMSGEMLVQMRLDGSVLRKGSLEPSTEIKLHLRIYRENPAVMSVVHAHPPVCTSFAVAGIALDQTVYPEALVNLGKVPCVPYQTPGTAGVADSVVPYCKEYNAVLLGNHGALTWGASPMEAYFRMESMEHYAVILLNTGFLIGKANTLTAQQLDELNAIRERMPLIRPDGGSV